MTVPAASLKAVREVDARASFNTTMLSSATTKAGDWDVSLHLRSIARGKDGAALGGGEVTLK